MRVLHLHKVSGIGGSERHLLTLLPALAKRGVAPVMCVLETPKSGAFIRLMKDVGVEVVAVGVGSHIDPSLFGRLRARVQSLQPDLIHTHLFHADIYGQPVARSLRIPSVLSLHATSFLYRGPHIRLAIAAATRLSGQVIAISAHVASTASRSRITPPAKTKLIYYGIHASHWLMSDSERAQARERFGWSDEKFVVGAASRMVPLKGHDFLIAAFGQALPCLPGGILALAGQGPLFPELKQLVKREALDASVQFLGFVEDVRAFLNACDVVVFPTLPGFGEGLGLAALEAMAAGRATIATDIDSLPELLLDGESGNLIQPWDVEALAGLIIGLREDPSRRLWLGTNAHERAKTRFTVDKMTDETLRAYEDTLFRAGV